MPDETLRISYVGPVAELILNRPEKLNALSRAMEAALIKALAEVSERADTKVVILRGEGRAFSTGHDLVELFAEDRPDAAAWRDYFKVSIEAVMAVWNCPKPVIAAVHGHVLAGGWELASAADVIIASDDAGFGYPEVRAGDLPLVFLLPWLVDIRRCKRIVFSGQTLSASEALAAGLVDEVVGRDRIFERARQEALSISTTPLPALQFLKKATNRTYDAMGLTAAIEAIVEESCRYMAASNDALETFRLLLRERGLREALKYRDRRTGS